MEPELRVMIQGKSSQEVKEQGRSRDGKHRWVIDGRRPGRGQVNKVVNTCCMPTGKELQTVPGASPGVRWQSIMDSCCHHRHGWVSTSFRGSREEVVLFLVSSVSDKFLGLVPLA